MAELSPQTDVREAVRARYADVARAAAAGAEATCDTGPSSCGCATDPIGAEQGFRGFGVGLYSGEQRGQLPEAAQLASLGCGVPTAVADLQQGESVLDLGSGAGADALISARRVGPTGKVYGLDMTDEMLDLARANAAKQGSRTSSS